MFFKGRKLSPDSQYCHIHMIQQAIKMIRHEKGQENVTYNQEQQQHNDLKTKQNKTQTLRGHRHCN